MYLSVYKTLTHTSTHTPSHVPFQSRLGSLGGGGFTPRLAGRRARRLAVRRSRARRRSLARHPCYVRLESYSFAQQRPPSYYRQTTQTESRGRIPSHHHRSSNHSPKHSNHSYSHVVPATITLVVADPRRGLGSVASIRSPGLVVSRLYLSTVCRSAH